MSLIKLAWFDTKEQRQTLKNKQEKLYKQHWDNMMNEHNKKYVKKITALAKKEGIADPTRKAKIGGAIGAGIGAVSGAGLGVALKDGGKLVKGLRGIQFGIGGGALGAIAGLNLGGKKERQYLHAKYPSLERQSEKFDNQWKAFEKNHL